MRLRACVCRLCSVSFRATWLPNVFAFVFCRSVGWLVGWLVCVNTIWVRPLCVTCSYVVCAHTHTCEHRRFTAADPPRAMRMHCKCAVFVCVRFVCMGVCITRLCSSQPCDVMIYPTHTQTRERKHHAHCNRSGMEIIKQIKTQIHQILMSLIVAARTTTTGFFLCYTNFRIFALTVFWEKCV